MDKLTAKQEAFAQAVAGGMNQSDAYRAAFKVRPTTLLSSVNVNASKQMALPKVAKRVADLRAPVAAAVGVTLESHLASLEDLRDRAMRRHQYAAAISAEIARGKAAGVHIERSAVEVTNGDDDDARAAALAERLERSQSAETRH